MTCSEHCPKHKRRAQSGDTAFAVLVVLHSAAMLAAIGAAVKYIFFA